jgi:hypothetical protein
MRAPVFQAVALVAALTLSQAHAQAIDELDIRREGNDAVLQVRFSTEVQFRRAISTRSGDLVLVSYNLLTTTNDRLRAANQVLRLRATDNLPTIEVADETDRGDQARRLVVRFAKAIEARARAGRGNRSIEIVLIGRGNDVQAPPQARSRTPTAPAGPVQAAATPPTSAAIPTVPATVPVPATQAPAPAPQVTATPPAAPTSTARAPQAPTTPATAASAAGTTSPAVQASVPAPTRGAPEVEAKAEPLMAQARTAFQSGQWTAALTALNQLLEMPPSSFTREAQELAGLAHLNNGDPARARAEFETYLQLFPAGPGSDRVRQQLASLPAPATAAVAAPAPVAEKEVTLSGSSSMTYYGGNGQIRSRDFQDSPISGLPQVAGDPQLSSDRSKQLYNDIDIYWRRRNDEVDQRFVLRDSYINDLERSDKSKNRLSALYFDHKSQTGGWGVRLGRQSPTGGGVMSRFDGVAANLTLKKRVKFGFVAGNPTDRFFDSRRRFFGVSADGDRLLGNLGGGVYAIEQRIDGQIDRRAVGLDLRWFNGGTTIFSQFDYDLLIKGLNVATVQGTWILKDNTVINALYDRRALTTLTLGNALTFGDPANPGALFTRIQDKLDTTTLTALRDQVKRTTPTITQAQLGITKPWSSHWQTAASVQLTNTGAIPPVPEVAGYEDGRAATGNIYTTSAQLIGLNLYSSRDTHVLSVSVISSPNLKGTLMAYNNSSFTSEFWQIEPSLQYYRDSNDLGGTSQRWTPGLRVTYRGWKRWSVESALTYEIGRTTRKSPDPTQPELTVTTEETTRRVNYSLGARYEF